MFFFFFSGLFLVKKQGLSRANLADRYFFRIVLVKVSCIVAFHNDCNVKSNFMILIFAFLAVCLPLTHKQALNHRHVSILLLLDNSQLKRPLFCPSHQQKWNQTAAIFYALFFHQKLGGGAAGFICSAGRQSNFIADLCLFIFGKISSEREKWVTASLQCVIVESIASAALPPRCQQSSRRHKTSSEV